MSKEFGPFSVAKKIVVFNPDSPSQVRQVSGSGSPQWVSVASATFSQCVTSTSATGAFNWADLPTGLFATTAYTLAVYSSTATAFTDASEFWEYRPTVGLTDSEHDHLMSIDPTFATVASLVDDTQTLTLVEGDDYTIQPITFDRTNSPDFTAATVSLGIVALADYQASGTDATPLATISGSVNISSSTATFTFIPLSSDLSSIPTSPPSDPLAMIYQVRATISGKKITTHLGACTMTRKVLA